MRGVDMALTAFVLWTSPTVPAKAERRVLPFIDEADAAMLGRAALPQQSAALIASLWPPARQCVVRAVYLGLGAPAAFGAVFRLSWRAPKPDSARVLKNRLQIASATA